MCNLIAVTSMLHLEAHRTRIAVGLVISRYIKMRLFLSLASGPFNFDRDLTVSE